MKTQDPIENQIKERLDGVQRSTEVPSWQAVSESLKRRKQRKNFIWFWSSIGVLAVLAIILYPKIGTTAETPVDTEVRTEQTIVNTTDNTSTEQTQDLTSGNESTAPETTTAVTDNTAPVTTDTDPNVIDDFTKDAEVSPTYYYFDSESGVQISTSDKRVIDSLLQRETPLKVKDSI